MTGGQILKIARKTKCMTQAMTADTYGVGIRTLQNWESSRTAVSYDDVMGILAGVLGFNNNEIKGLLLNENNKSC